MYFRNEAHVLQIVSRILMVKPSVSVFCQPGMYLYHKCVLILMKLNSTKIHVYSRNMMTSVANGYTCISISQNHQTPEYIVLYYIDVVLIVYFTNVEIFMIYITKQLSCICHIEGIIVCSINNMCLRVYMN